MTTRKRKKKAVRLVTITPNCCHQIASNGATCGKPAKYKVRKEWYCEGHFNPFPDTGSREEPLAVVKKSLTPRKPKSVGMTPFRGYVPVAVGLGIPSRDVCEGTLCVSPTKSHCVQYQGASNGYRPAKVIVTELGTDTSAATIEEVRELATEWATHPGWSESRRDAGRCILHILDRSKA